jgi:transcription elongation GreA/GreB family factor
VGKVLLGHRVGDEVEVEAPQGTMRFRVDNVSQGT